MYYNTPYNAPYGVSAQRYEIIRVNGQNGAQAFQMAPNSQALLLDETAPKIWLAMTDGAGYKTVTAYDITLSQTAEQKEQSKFDMIEQRLRRLEDRINESHTQHDDAEQSVGDGTAV